MVWPENKQSCILEIWLYSTIVYDLIHQKHVSYLMFPLHKLGTVETDSHVTWNSLKHNCASDACDGDRVDSVATVH